MIVKIAPSTAQGRMEAPPSKSIAHRMLICAGCAEGTSTIKNVDLSRDIAATLDCLRALGAEAVYENRCVTIRGVNPLTLADSPRLDCAECGSTLRFMIPLCLMSGQLCGLTGSGRLFSRPLSIYEEICREQGLYFEKKENNLFVRGRLSAGDYTIPGNISSQFISGLLFALPLLERDSRIRLLPPVESRSYIDMTIRTLESFGVRASWLDACTLGISGGQRYCARKDLRVEGDYSNAAFFDAFNLLGGEVQLYGLDENSLQGDRVYRRYFEQLRAGFAEIDLSDCPDLGPVLMALAALYHGAGFTGTARLRIKESDRGAAMQQELGKLKVRVERSENEIRIFPGVSSPQDLLDGHNDHRIVMALSLLLTKTGGAIRGAQAVAKSLPDYFDRLKELGIGLTVIDKPE